ncbi:hypothetical protein FF2_029958 [Malus domestica]
MKGEKVDSTAKVVPGPVPPSVVIDSSAKKLMSVRMGSCERSIDYEAGEFLEVCALLKVDLLEDVDVCIKFVDSVGKVVISSDFFAKHIAYSIKSFLIATMHKTLILATESIRIDQDAVKCAKKVKVVLTAQIHLATETIKKLKSELAILKGYDVSTLTSMQLETTHEVVAHLKAAKKEVSHVSPVVKNLERVNLDPRSACFAKYEEIVFMHAEVSRLKDVPSKLESKEVDLQGVLSASENLKKELDKLEGVHTRLVEENVQLKNEKVGHEVVLTSCQADFYNLGYVDHFQGRSLDYEISKKDFETFSISPVDLLNFSFEAAFGGAAEI